MSKNQNSGKNEIFISLAAIGQAMGNANRLKIISLLSHGEKNVERLAEAIGQSLAATSAHLKVLRSAGLVTADKRGRNVYCQLRSERVAALWIALRELGEHLLPEVRELLKESFDSQPALSPLSEKEVWSQVRRGRGVLVDLRPEDEFVAGHLPKARHLPFTELTDRAHELPTDRDLLVYCRGPYCLMAFEGVDQLQKLKFPAQRLRFSVPEWRAAGLPVISESSE